MYKKSFQGVVVVVMLLLLLLSCKGAENNGQATPTLSPQADKSSETEVSAAERAILSLLSQRITTLETAMEALTAQVGALPTPTPTPDMSVATPEPTALPTSLPVLTSTPSVSLPPEPSAAEKEKEAVSVPDYYSYSIREGGAVITGWSGTSTVLTVPAEIGGYPVIALADSAFAESAVVEVYLPETLREIGWFAFYGCGSLKKVYLPTGIERIGYAAFDGCGADLILTVSRGSYAEEYAASFALPLEYQPE